MSNCRALQRHALVVTLKIPTLRLQYALYSGRFESYCEQAAVRVAESKFQASSISVNGPTRELDRNGLTGTRPGVNFGKPQADTVLYPRRVARSPHGGRALADCRCMAKNTYKIDINSPTDQFLFHVTHAIPLKRTFQNEKYRRT